MNAYKKAQRDTINKLLKENMGIEKIASILGCDISCVKEVKKDMQV